MMAEVFVCMYVFVLVCFFHCIPNACNNECIALIKYLLNICLSMKKGHRINF